MGYEGSASPASELPVPLSEAGLKYDERGFPLIKPRNIEGFHFHPVTHAQFALGKYGKHLKGEPGDFFLSAADRLIEVQGEDGSYRYPFPFRHYTLERPYEPGWISGMAQGQVLSVLSRAFLLSSDPKYLEAGERALAFLTKGKEDGGPMTTLADLDPSLAGYIFFEEYVTNPDVYTLNGYVFTLLGLYDFWQASGSETARSYFDRGVASLKLILPLYEVADFSAYDLSHLTVKRETYRSRGIPHMSARYHPIHIMLLHALASVTGDDMFAATADKWETFVPQ